jgi:archaemetzincin
MLGRLSVSKVTKLAILALPLGVAAQFFVSPSSGDEKKRIATLQALIEKVTPLHEAFGEPQPGDWIVKHPEGGQTFAQYLQTSPTTPQGKRTVIYVQPLGDFTTSQEKIVRLTADFISRYFDRRVNILPRVPLSVIPESARRKNPNSGDEQILTSFVLDRVLKPALPKDAAAMIAFTTSDLWPGEGWNYVFGQASISDRVGVWSINRNGDPDAGDSEFNLCLLRAMKTAAHETGHMLTMQHCTKFECNMCGSNNLSESDRRPVEVCPECLAKICWATGCDPAERFRKLAEFCKQQGLEPQRQFYERLHDAVTTVRIDSKQ